MTGLVLEEQLRQADRRRKLPPPPMRRAIRVTSGLTVTAVAEHCGVSHTTITLWESGRRNPSGPRLERYADLLDRLAKGQA